MKNSEGLMISTKGAIKKEKTAMIAIEEEGKA